MTNRHKRPAKQRPTRQADTHRIKTKSRLAHYLAHHLHALVASLGHIWRAPVASIMTIGVIAIALALPMGLYVLLQNAKFVSQGWDEGAQISLFLKMDVSEQQAQALLAEIKVNNDVADANYISPTAGLKEFEQQSGFGDVLKQLHDNPLPAVIVVHPAATLDTPAAIDNLLQQLNHLPEVDNAQLDMQWIKRLYALINLAQHGLYALGGLLALAVLLIIGNTMRLAMQNYRPEIEVYKLVGATNAFIRRPFIYNGMLFGLFGAGLAYTLVYALLMSLSGSVAQLSQLYHVNFAIHGINSQSLIGLLVSGIMLGFLGSRLSVGRQLKSIEPE